MTSDRLARKLMYSKQMKLAGVYHAAQVNTDAITAPKEETPLYVGYRVYASGNGSMVRIIENYISDSKGSQ